MSNEVDFDQEPTGNLPVTAEDMKNAGFPEGLKMATGLAIFFNEPLYLRCKAIAMRMAQADGIIGEHLRGKPSACLAVVSRAITWNLDPFAVAQSTYAVQGKIGYEGKLVQAILENSGRLEGRVTYEHKGPWEKLRGKFKMIETNEGGKKKRTPVQTWPDEDEVDLSVIVRAQVKGEPAPREEEFFLAEMQPRNSTLWILRPKQQICYAAVRAFANIAAPSLLMGIPFDVDPSGFHDPMVDITPQPPPPRPEKPNAFARKPEPEANTVIGEGAGETSFGGAGIATDQLQMNNVAEPQQNGEAATPSESPPAPQEATQDGGETSEEAEEPKETPLALGKRLLSLVTTIPMLAELRDSIDTSLVGDDLARQLWDTACSARGIEITGPKKTKSQTER